MLVRSCTCTLTRGRTHPHTQSCAHTRECTFVHAHPCIHTHARGLVHVHPCTSSCEYTYIQTHLHTLTHKHAHMSAHMQTRAHSCTQDIRTYTLIQLCMHDTNAPMCMGFRGKSLIKNFFQADLLCIITLCLYHNFLLFHYTKFLSYKLKS